MPGLLNRLRRRDGKLDELRRAECLRACPDRELRWLAGAAELMTLEAGTTLQGEGASPRECHVVLEGDIVVTSRGEIIERPRGRLGVATDNPLTGVAATESVTAATRVRSLVLALSTARAATERCPIFSAEGLMAPRQQRLGFDSTKGTVLS